MVEELSPLMQALYRDQSDQAADILARLSPDRLTIHEAAAAGVVDRVAALLEADPSSANAWSPDGFQPLGLACYFGHRPVVEQLLEHGAEINTPARNPMGVTALHAALAGPDPEAARLLVARGADVNARQSGGNTPLHTTAFNGHLELTRVLLEAGADPSLQSDDGKTARDVALEHGHTEVAALL
jgi:ankyrin repeat protein